MLFIFLCVDKTQDMQILTQMFQNMYTLLKMTLMNVDLCDMWNSLMDYSHSEQVLLIVFMLY